MRIVAVVGADLTRRTAAVEKLVAGLTARGAGVGVAVYRVFGRPEAEDDPAARYARAGASQVLVNRGKEPCFQQRLAGLTPLRRVAARYFNAQDVVLGDGYLDPGEWISVGPPPAGRDDGLLAVIGEAGGGFPSFPPRDIAPLADLLLGEK